MKENYRTKGHRGFCIERRIPIYETLKTMQPLSHWPNRPMTWKLEASEVIEFITYLIDEHYPDFTDDWLLEAKRIMVNASHCNPRIIVFDPETRLWRGVNWQEAQP